MLNNLGYINNKNINNVSAIKLLVQSKLSSLNHVSIWALERKNDFFRLEQKKSRLL